MELSQTPTEAPSVILVTFHLPGIKLISGAFVTIGLSRPVRPPRQLILRSGAEKLDEFDAKGS